MRKSVRITLLLLCLTLFTTGCWDYREVHQITFVTTIGVDYKNGKYTLYAQALNFGNIAQQEGVRPSKHKAVVGVAEGDSITQAMFNLYRSEMQFIYWGHITAILFSRQALEQVKVESLVDSVNRFRELRYNVWVFGTDESIEQVMNIAPYFGHSPYDSRLMKPEQAYRQFSDVKPIYLNRFISDYFERGKSVLLPRIVIDRTTWTEGASGIPELKLNGIYVFGSDYRGVLTEEQAKGSRYADSQSVRLPVSVLWKGKPAALIVVNKPRIRIDHTVTDGRVRFRLTIRTNGYIDEMLQDVPLQYLERQVSDTIEREVREAFDNGKRIQADVLNLTAPLYRYHYDVWKRYVTEKTNMNAIELGSVTVKFTLIHTGKYKYGLQ